MRARSATSTARSTPNSSAPKSRRANPRRHAEFTFRKAVGTKGTGARQGSRFAAVRRRAQAEAHGFGGTDPSLGRMLENRRANDCARALSDFVQQNLGADRDGLPPVRVNLRQELLAPLP